MVEDQGIDKGKDAETALEKCIPSFLHSGLPPFSPSIISHVVTEISPCIRSCRPRNRPDTSPHPLRAPSEERTWAQADSDVWEMRGSGLWAPEVDMTNGPQDQQSSGWADF